MNTTCPRCSGYGWLQDTAVEIGRSRCPVCCGNGFVARSLPAGQEVKVVASDLGFTRHKYWSPLSGTGSIHGLAITGKAVATDGVLIVIEQPNGEQFIGHFDNWVKDKTEKEKSKRERIDVNVGRFE